MVVRGSSQFTILPPAASKNDARFKSGKNGLDTERFTDLGKLNFGGSALGSTQFSILPQLHQKTMLASKGSKLTQK